MLKDNNPTKRYLQTKCLQNIEIIRHFGSSKELYQMRLNSKNKTWDYLKTSLAPVGINRRKN